MLSSADECAVLFLISDLYSSVGCCRASEAVCSLCRFLFFARIRHTCCYGNQLMDRSRFLSPRLARKKQTLEQRRVTIPGAQRLGERLSQAELGVINVLFAARPLHSCRAARQRRPRSLSARSALLRRQLLDGSGSLFCVRSHPSRAAGGCPGDIVFMQLKELFSGPPH